MSDLTDKLNDQADFWRYYAMSSSDSQFEMTDDAHARVIGLRQIAAQLSTQANREKTELDELLEAFGVTPTFIVENIKQAAMNRCKVKKSRRPHIKRILDEAFRELKKEVSGE